MFALASHVPDTDRSFLDAVARRRLRIGFALTHPTVVVGLALGAGVSTGLVGAGLLALHGLVELHWQVTDRDDEPAGIPLAAVYDDPS